MVAQQQYQGLIVRFHSFSLNVQFFILGLLESHCKMVVVSRDLHTFALWNKMTVQRTNNKNFLPMQFYLLLEGKPSKETSIYFQNLIGTIFLLLSYCLPAHRKVVLPVLSFPNTMRGLRPPISQLTYYSSVPSCFCREMLAMP